MKRDTSLRVLPSHEGEAPTVRVRTAEDAFAGPALDAASVYGELPLELRLMALGLASAGSTVGAASAPHHVTTSPNSEQVPTPRRRKAA
jgi:hypothetical protein